MDDSHKPTAEQLPEIEQLDRFTESYASFNRIINSLQRKYIELKDEFSAQNEMLVEANKRLVSLSERNLVATEFLDSILNSISAGVIAVDEEGRVTHFNPAASTILGIPKTVPPGRLYRDVIQPGKPPDANALRATQTGRDVTSAEKHIELANGKKLNLSVSTAILKDGHGKARGAVEVIQDLTRIKKMEQELARLNTLAALGEMAASVAHEVRNPLTAIAGFAALLERELDESDPKMRTVKKITDGVETLNETVEALLDYTRFGEIKKTTVEYGNFLEEIVGHYTATNRRKLGETAIGVQQPDEQIPTEVALDKVLFRQVLFNILDNCVQILAGAGNVRLSYKRLPRREAIARHGDRLILENDETVLETTVADDGPGIEPDAQDRVFSPFYSTRPGGHGLGLAVAFKIMKAHTGNIYVNRSHEGGAAFHLLLPVRTMDDNPERAK